MMCFQSFCFRASLKYLLFGSFLCNLLFVLFIVVAGLGCVVVVLVQVLVVGWGGGFVGWGGAAGCVGCFVQVRLWENPVLLWRHRSGRCGFVGVVLVVCGWHVVWVGCGGGLLEVGAWLVEVGRGCWRSGLVFGVFKNV